MFKPKLSLTLRIFAATLAVAQTQSQTQAQSTA